MEKTDLQPVRFKEAREYLNITQTDVENAIGLSRTSVSHHESNYVPKPNVHYVLFLAENGINPHWLVCKSNQMIANNSNDMNDIEVETLKKEKSYLEKRIEKLEETVKQLMATVHLLSGKNSEHKHAANPNEKLKNVFDLGLSYVPAFT